ncbi:hypothetical protein DFH09DRAFT_1253383 [Mycena vulgaris]|nr:hypothetical protein DFH09DRAFT_1253383 [Mycena vulgaris]
MLRREGCGVHRDYPGCAACVEGNTKHRCVDCLGGGQLLCVDCIVSCHRQLPLHRIEHWTGTQLLRKTLKTLGLRIQLGHWYGPDRRCPLSAPAAGDDFVIVDDHGVHEVALDYCSCGQGGTETVQLLRGGLWPATTTAPRTAATFTVLHRYHLLSFESKCSAYEFYQSLARETDNTKHKATKDRYHEFLRMTREWLTRADAEARCSTAGKNMSPGREDAPEEKQFLHALFLAMDANFRLKRKDVSTEEKDPGLGKGWVFFCEVKAYMAHVVANWDQKQERSHCVAHDAVDKPDREARGTASSGIGAVDCARHNMKRPNAVGDLQLGERYLNMDYMFFRSVAGTKLVRFFVSYDIACQWHIHIWQRMAGYKNETLTIDGAGKFMTFLVPKFHLPAHIEVCNLRFSFNLTRDVGQTDGEAPERGWANANPLARSTKEMGPGSRRDTLDDHFNDWNHKKIIALGRLRRQVPEMVKTERALADMNESVGSEGVKDWTEMAVKWERDPDAPNPFETLRKDTHLAKVRSELATEAAAREAAGNEDAGAVRDDMHITELLSMGLQLEDQQCILQRMGWTTPNHGFRRILGFDVAATDWHPTDNQRRTMVERTTKLRRKIFAWIDVQAKFFPELVRVRELEDDADQGLRRSDLALWLPSAIAAALGCGRDVPSCKTEIMEHEYRLRVGQANEALHEVRRLLLVRTHLYKLKDTHSRGVRANTRSADKIAALKDRTRRAAAQYRAARATLETLGRVLKRNEWSWTLQELKEEDVRGLPRSHFGDPLQQAGKKVRKARQSRTKKARVEREERPLSWIWIARGEKHDPKANEALTEAVRIEWEKARARRLRWSEEVDLLEEEMNRVLRFMSWRVDWWRDQIDLRGLPEGPQLEGETAYALGQAALQEELLEVFAKDWQRDHRHFLPRSVIPITSHSSLSKTLLCR